MLTWNQEFPKVMAEFRFERHQVFPLFTRRETLPSKLLDSLTCGP